MHNLLEFRNLRKSFAGPGEGDEKRLLFDRVSAAVEPADRIALLGVSGQGKSTLLRILARLDVMDAGELLLNGTSARAVDPRIWRKNVGYVAQHAVMLPGTVEDNLRTVSMLHGTPYDRGLAGRLLDRMGLGELDVRKQASDLSGGEKQRVSLIRSLLLRPKALLLDEITASLDRSGRENVELALQDWNRREGTALVWVTHDLEQARTVSQRTWFMAGGTLLEDAPTESFFREPRTAEGRMFASSGKTGEGR
ncbi:ABC transporter ATP-binding protein [Cohnella massiliensis]|uniref:ABC transporter ATP-binding protein n=1 Tax=Cohnella massiliensis TaxID=1816691 RepID=UPI0031831557